MRSLLFALLVLPWPAAAQHVASLGAGRAEGDARPASLDYPDRAAAIRPAGLVETTLTWGTGRSDGGLDACEEHLLSTAVEARIPIDELIIELSWMQVTYYRWYSDVGTAYDGTYLRFGSPRLGASWRQQREGWRIEVGGAFAPPTVVDEPVSPLVIPIAPGSIVFEPDASHYARHRGGWNAYQLTRDRLALVAHVRAEVDPDAQVVLGIELDLPVVFELDRDEVAVLPQLALEGAWRFAPASLLGLRAQLVTTHVSSGDDGYGAVALLEPFFRLAADTPHAAPFFTTRLQIVLGPDQPVSFAPSSMCSGMFGLTVGGGVLF